MKLHDFWSKRCDSVPAALGGLARHRPEDSVALRPHLLALLLDEHDRILIKTDIRTILSCEGFRLTHHDRAIDLLFFHGLARLGGLDRNDHDVANARITTLAAARHLEDTRNLAAGIISYSDDGLRLQHIILCLRSLPSRQSRIASASR